MRNVYLLSVWGWIGWGLLFYQETRAFQSQDLDCQSVEIHSNDLIGLLSYSQDSDVEKVRLIYKVRENKGKKVSQKQVDLSLLKNDAKNLKKKVKVLLSHEGTELSGSNEQRLQVRAERLPNGGCFNSWVEE